MVQGSAWLLASSQTCDAKSQLQASLLEIRPFSGRHNESGRTDINQNTAVAGPAGLTRLFSMVHTRPGQMVGVVFRCGPLLGESVCC